MSAPFKHAFQQGANLKTLFSVGLSAVGKTPDVPLPELPGAKVEAVLAPRPKALVDDFVRWSGGNPKAWQGTLPPTLFPQWGFPLLAPTLKGLPFPLAKALNQGCRITVNAPLPADAPLQVRAQLVAIDAQPHKARIHQQLVTGTEEVPEALVCDVYAVVPLGGPKPEGSAKRDKPRVSTEALELGRLSLPKGAGWEFAVLTGDFNPIHWLVPYAKVAGFKRVILHGFATLARSFETVVAARWAGDPLRLGQLDVRFTRPVVLPATPGVYLEPADDGAHGLSVGEAPGSPVNMLGTITTREA